MFKKQGEKEQIRVRRLGLLRELSQVGDRVPVLPFIDTEVRFSLDTRRVLFPMENVLTTDKVFYRRPTPEVPKKYPILLSVPLIVAARQFGAFVTRRNVVLERRMRQRYATTIPFQSH